jgi:hypothetical protein
MSKSAKKQFSLSVFGLAAKRGGAANRSEADSKTPDFSAQLRAFGVSKEAITFKHATMKGKEKGTPR